jgi:hypothetical protein
MDQNTRIERAKRVLFGLRAELEQAEKALESAEVQKDIEAGNIMDRHGSGLAEFGAMLVDIVHGREHTHRRPGSRPAATTTSKVRKALGYTYP